MAIKINRESVGKLAVFFTMMFVFLPRSIFAQVFFNSVGLYVMYAITYGALLYCFLKSFKLKGRTKIKIPDTFWWTFLPMVTVFFGLYRGAGMRLMLGYGIAFLVPFAIYDGIKNSARYGIVLVAIAMFLVIGCTINYTMPELYRSIIVPLFQGRDRESVLWQLQKELNYPGFLSQVGYVSFFLAIGAGTLFSFRKTVFRQKFIPLLAIIIFGMFLTGKRSPIVFMLVAMMLLYFFEGNTRQKVQRLAKIVGIILAAYAAISVLAHADIDIGGIDRIYYAIQELISTGSVEDLGRKQLYNQAWMYFRENPLFGIGWQNFHIIFTARGTHVHNIYLQLLCESGVVGFCVFMTLFASGLIKTIRALAQNRNEISIRKSWLEWALFTQFYFLLYGITGNPLYDSEEIILYFFAIGVTLCCSRKTEYKSVIRSIGD